MKKKGHPAYQEALFIDSSTGMKFVCGTTLTSGQTTVVSGKEMATTVVSISSASHPFFVGGSQLVDTEGRVDRFKKRYLPKPPVQPKKPEEEKKPLLKKKA